MGLGGRLITPPPGGGIASGGSAAPSELLTALQDWSGTGSADNLLHESLFPADIAPGVPVQVATGGFKATRIVVDNNTPLPLVLGLGARPAFVKNGYDVAVPGNSLLTMRVPALQDLWVLQQAAGARGVGGGVEGYLLAGSIAAEGPAFEITPHPVTWAPEARIAGIVGSVHPSTPLVWLGGADPFGGAPVFLDEVFYAQEHGPAAAAQ